MRPELSELRDKFLDVTKPGPTLGGDPEIFLYGRDVEGNQIPVCPSVWMPESKVYMDMGEIGGYNRDGLAWEFNPAPTTSPKVSAERLAKLYHQARNIIELAECTFSIQPAVVIDLKREFPRDVFEIGCMPDFDAYSGKQNKVVVDARKFSKRFAGGHISLSHKSLQTFEDAVKLMPWLDTLVGTYSTYCQPDKENALERRQVYGKAGSFRWKAHNKVLEYRAPDNGIMVPRYTPASHGKPPYAMDRWQTALMLVQQAVMRYVRGLEVPSALLADAIKSINSCSGNIAYKVLETGLKIQ